MNMSDGEYVEIPRLRQFFDESRDAMFEVKDTVYREFNSADPGRAGEEIAFYMSGVLKEIQWSDRLREWVAVVLWDQYGNTDDFEDIEVCRFDELALV